MSSGERRQSFGHLSVSLGTSWSNLSVTSAIDSYRRAQLYSTDATIESSDVEDLEAGLDVDEDEEDDVEERTASRRDNTIEGAHDNLQWEGLDEEGDQDNSGLTTPTTRKITYLLPPIVRAPLTRPHHPSETPQEQSPLLRRVSFSTQVRPQPRPRVDTDATLRLPETFNEGETKMAAPRRFSTGSNGSASFQHTIRRRSSSASIRSVRPPFRGKSTFGQTLFNAVAILMGIGMLSEPLAFAYAGWIGGTCMMIFAGCVTCYTAKILARIILEDPSLRTYADIGRKAFGPSSRYITSVIFCLELFAVSVALVTLYSDSLHALLPQYSHDTYKFIAFFLIVPTVFAPLVWLSYASVIGILATLVLMGVLVIDGLTKFQAPGSIWDPAPTDLLPGNATQLGLSFGLFMAGFAGHVIIPSLARDMKDPLQFNLMIDWAFFIATVLYGCIGAAGYLMFGRSVSEEVSKNMVGTIGFSLSLNKLALGMLVIAPLSKYALSTRPVNITLEIILGVDETPAPISSAPSADPDHGRPTPSGRLTQSQRVIFVLERLAFVALSVCVSIAVPEFERVMAFLGSFAAFLLSVIGPVSAKIALTRRCNWKDGALLAVAVIMGVWGTGAAFLAANS